MERCTTLMGFLDQGEIWFMCFYALAIFLVTVKVICYKVSWAVTVVHSFLLIRTASLIWSSGGYPSYIPFVFSLFTPDYFRILCVVFLRLTVQTPFDRRWCCQLFNTVILNDNFIIWAQLLHCLFTAIKFWTQILCIFRVCNTRPSVWVFSSYSGFVSQFKDIHSGELATESFVGVNLDDRDATSQSLMISECKLWLKTDGWMLVFPVRPQLVQYFFRQLLFCLNTLSLGHTVPTTGLPLCGPVFPGLPVIWKASQTVLNICWKTKVFLRTIIYSCQKSPLDRTSENCFSQCKSTFCFGVTLQRWVGVACGRMS